MIVWPLSCYHPNFIKLIGLLPILVRRKKNSAQREDKMKLIWLLTAGSFLLPSAALGDQKASEGQSAPPAAPYVAPETGYDLIPKRRRDQVRTTPGYIASPVAVNIPGIGFSYGLVGSVFNIKESEMDTFFFTTAGDTSGFGLGLVDTPIYGPFTFNIFANRFRDSGVEFNRRGMESSRDDRLIFKFKESNLFLTQFTLRLWEKRIQINLGTFLREGELDSILDKDGDVIGVPSQGRSKVLDKSLGATIDFTDDKSDPRDGMQFELQVYKPERSSSYQPDSLILDYNYLFYLPMLETSTWVFNAWRSDAYVTDKGETDAAVVRDRESLNCQFRPENERADCLKEEDEIVKSTILANKNGTATGMGGTLRMRSYVTSRFSSAHASMLGTEFRWNLTEEFTPFDIFVAKGVRTGLQLALFVEHGTVAESVGQLWDETKTSYGVGLRALIASGFIVRLDMASGDEGFQPVLFFNYPWFVF